jgi:general secretion pathway protein L
MSFMPKLRAFMRWWGEGLFNSLPDALRKLFHSDLPCLVLHLRDAQHVNVAWQQDGKTQTCGEFMLGDASAALDCVPAAMANKPYQVELRLGKTQTLNMQRHFPEAVKDNLRQVVGYQLDRLTPFSADNVFFDAYQIQHDKARKEVLADIYVVPRHIIERLLRQLEAAGIKEVNTISVANADRPVNLMQDQQAAQGQGWSMIPLYCFLGALALSLLAPLAYKYRRVEQIDTALAELRQSSAAQLEVRDKLMAAEDALKFLEQKRKTSPVALDVVEKLSAEIPEHTWLERLTLDGNVLEIRGESGKALSLIDMLEEAPEFSNVRFKSPVTRNKDNGNDRFHIEATVEVAHVE